MATDYAEKASLRAELERLRSTRMDHEREALEVQRLLEEKMEELKSVSEDLYQSQDTVDKLQVKIRDMLMMFIFHWFIVLSLSKYSQSIFSVTIEAKKQRRVGGQRVCYEF